MFDDKETQAVYEQVMKWASEAYENTECSGKCDEVDKIIREESFFNMKLKALKMALEVQKFKRSEGEISTFLKHEEEEPDPKLEPRHEITSYEKPSNTKHKSHCSKTYFIRENEKESYIVLRNTDLESRIVGIAEFKDLKKGDIIQIYDSDRNLVTEQRCSVWLVTDEIIRFDEIEPKLPVKPIEG